MQHTPEDNISYGTTGLPDHKTDANTNNTYDRKDKRYDNEMQHARSEQF